MKLDTKGHVVLEFEGGKFYFTKPGKDQLLAVAGLSSEFKDNPLGSLKPQIDFVLSELVKVEEVEIDGQAVDAEAFKKANIPSDILLSIFTKYVTDCLAKKVDAGQAEKNVESPSASLG
jgi:hypothetical protein